MNTEPTPSPASTNPDVGIPTVAIVGRPNVGKSSLLNAFAGRRIAIVEATPGVTRDRLGVILEHKGRVFEIVDTGGIGIVDEARLAEQIEIQIDFAIKRADVVIFLLDARDGVTPLDLEVAERIRQLEQPFVLAVNKIDSKELELNVHEFHELGLGEPMAVSATNRRGLNELIKEVAKQLPRRDLVRPRPAALRIAMVGRQNVGKSTFINALAQEERVIVSEVPGTTRDAIDVRFERQGKVYVAVDTAGLRKKKKMKKDAIEFYSSVRTQRAITDADAIIFMIDARSNVTKVDKQLADLVEESGKPVSIVLNKWDLTENVIPDQYIPYLNEQLPGLIYAPVSFTSAKVDFNVWETFELCEKLYDMSGQTVTTGQFNSLIEKLTQKQRPPQRLGRRGKIYYGTQTGTHPPTFTLFVNEPELFPPDYIRYVENTVREELPFSEIPVRIRLRARERRDISKS